MSEFLLHYKRVDPTTWVYLSSLLSLGLFFKFNRFWSVRNLDLLLLILLAPGLLLVQNGRLAQRAVVEGVLTQLDMSPVNTLLAQMQSLKNPNLTDTQRETLEAEIAPKPSPSIPQFDVALLRFRNMQRIEFIGFVWLLIVGSLLAIRLLIDPNMVRRPLLEPNLTTGGLIFLCVSSFVFLMANVVSSRPLEESLRSQIVRRMLEDDVIQPPIAQRRPGYALLALFPKIPTTPLTPAEVKPWPIPEGNESKETSGTDLSNAEPARTGDAKPGDAKPNDAKPNDAKPGDESNGATLNESTSDGSTPDGAESGAPNLEPDKTPSSPDAPILSEDTLGGETRSEQLRGEQLGGEQPGGDHPEGETKAETEGGSMAASREQGDSGSLLPATRLIAMLSHLAIVLGIMVVGYRHFDSLKTGVGAATLYLLLPYTAQMTGYIEHSIPAALLVWAVVFYRRPATAGAFLGLAIGCYYYPVFLLPLWISFYWQRGLGRFVAGVLSMIVLLVALLFFKSANMAEFGEHMRTMFGVWTPIMEDLEGLWGLGWDPWYRVPILALFVGTTGTLAIWPAQKNLGTLISCSGAVMVATQFWHGFGGGLYMGWYMPLLLLTIFRPNLEDRIALSVLGEGWFPRRKRIAA